MAAFSEELLLKRYLLCSTKLMHCPWFLNAAPASAGRVTTAVTSVARDVTRRAERC